MAEFKRVSCSFGYSRSVTYEKKQIKINELWKWKLSTHLKRRRKLDDPMRYEVHWLFWELHSESILFYSNIFGSLDLWHLTQSLRSSLCLPLNTAIDVIYQRPNWNCHGMFLRTALWSIGSSIWKLSRESCRNDSTLLPWIFLQREWDASNQRLEVSPSRMRSFRSWIRSFWKKITKKKHRWQKGIWAMKSKRNHPLFIIKQIIFMIRQMISSILAIFFRKFKRTRRLDDCSWHRSAFVRSFDFCVFYLGRTLSIM